MADVLPTAQSWRQFIDRLFLWTGVLALAIAIIFFFAYNWYGMSRFVKFGIVEALIVAALLGYWKLGPDRIVGKSSLMLAAILLGILLALFGQTYQTGADPWQLFANWALLILPWLLVGRFAALWIFWIALINLSLFLYFSVIPGMWSFLVSKETQLFLVFAFNTLALLCWEMGARRFTWLAERWAVRFLAIASGVTITMLMLQSIFDWHDTSGWINLIYPLWLLVIYAIYRTRIDDLFMLAGGSLSLIIVVTSLLARTLLEHGNAISFLLIALAVIGMSAAAAMWLRRIHAEQKES